MNKQEVITEMKRYSEVSQEIISANIRRLLQEYGVLSIELGRRVGVTQQTVYSWTKQKYGNKPSFDAVLKLCLAFGVELDELIWSGVELPESEQKPKCTTEGCENEADAAKGLCKKCYKAMRRAKQREVK